MIFKQFKTAVILSGLFGLVSLSTFPAIVFGDTGATWKPSILPSLKKDYRGAEDPIEIALPTSLNKKDFEGLVLELDFMEVDPEFVQFRGNMMVLTPPFPMEFG